MSRFWSKGAYLSAIFIIVRAIGAGAQVPAAPTLASPSNNTTDIAINPTLSWSTVSGATSYNYQIATSTGFVSATWSISGLTSSSTALSPLPVNLDGQLYGNGALLTLRSPPSNLTNYPVPIVITGNTQMGKVCNPDGGDIRFMDVNGNLLYHQIVSFSVTGGAASGLWFVNVPNLSPHTQIWCLFGAPAQTQHNRAWQANVWDQYFAAVYHFSQNGTLSLLDATANKNDLELWPGNANKSATVIASTTMLGCGLTGAYLGYQGVLVAVDSPSLNITGKNLTEESWILPLSTSPASEWIGKYTPQNPENTLCGYYMEYLNVEGLGCEFGYFNNVSYTDNPRLNTTTSIPLNTITYIAGELTNGISSVSYNGVNQPGTLPYQTGPDSITEDTSSLFIGFGQGGNSFNYGTVFETRVSSIARSAAWITYTDTVLSSATGGVASMESPSLLNNNTLYYWEVNAADGNGAGAWSSAWSFTTIIAAPGAPVLSSPSNGAAGQATSLTLSWNSASNATAYAVQVSTDVNFGSTMASQSGLTVTSASINGLANATTYYWRADAKDTGGVSGWSAPWSFTTIIAAPGVPVLSSPLNGAAGQAASLTLSWNSASNATAYAVQVSTDVTFGSTVTSQSGLTVTSASINGLANATTYYWRADAKDAGGVSGWSGAWSFTVVYTAALSQKDASYSKGISFSNSAITYDLPASASVSLALYDMQGRQVRQLVNAMQNAGSYTINFNHAKVTAGYYIVELKAGSFIVQKKLALTN